MKRDEHLPIAQEKRLEFVERLVYFHGVISREDIMNRFHISAASATNILSIYNQKAPENLSYNVRLKRYEIGKFFKPVFDVRMLTERIPVYTIPKLHDPADDDGIGRIALISRAIQRTQSLTIIYSSASRKSERQVVPVAFANNLLRWHLRAYDRKRKRYADFVFERIQKVRPIKGDTVQAHEHPDKDEQWHSFINLKIKAHPHNVTDSQSFDMGNNVRDIEIRAAMAGYFLRLWNVDCSPNASLRGNEYQYVLTNMVEVAKVADLMLAPGYTME